MGSSVQMFATAEAGLERAAARLEKSAARLARLPLSGEGSTDEVNLSEEVINLLFAKRSYEANLTAVNAAKEMAKYVRDNADFGTFKDGAYICIN